jgi:SOS-response transcriptional repressor LexA
MSARGTAARVRTRRASVARLGPTDRQLQVLRFLASYEDAHGMPPTFAELLVELGVPVEMKGTAQSHLRALWKSGHVDRPTTPGAPRGWRINATGRELVGASRRCPHCGGALA